MGVIYDKENEDYGDFPKGTWKLNSSQHNFHTHSGIRLVT